MQALLKIAQLTWGQRKEKYWDIDSTWRVLKNSLVPWREPTFICNVSHGNPDTLCLSLPCKSRAFSTCWIQNKKLESVECQSWHLIGIYFSVIKCFIFCLFCMVWAYLPFSRMKVFIFAWKTRGTIFMKIFTVNTCEGNTFTMQK